MRRWKRVAAGLALVGLLGMGGAEIAAFPQLMPAPYIETKQRAVLTADITNSTTTLANVSALSCGVGSGQTFTFEYVLVLRSAATTNGIKLSISGPASPAIVSYQGSFPYSAGGNVDAFWVAFDDPIVGAEVIAANYDLVAIICGTVKAGVSSGQVFPKFAASFNMGQTVTMRAGSSFECQLFPG